MIQIRNLSYRYPRAAQPIFNDLTLEIPSGQFCAVMGANGSGKSTLCYTISGFIPHFYRGELSGEVRVAEHDVPHTPLAQLSGEVGLVVANPFNQITGAKFTVREEIAFGLENMGVARREMERRIDRILALTGLEELGNRSPYALSGGQQQRLAIASVLVMEPKVLVLDEPTAQLDPDRTRDVFDLLRSFADSRKATVVLAGDRAEWVAVYADRLIVLQEGQIAGDGPPVQVLSNPELAAYGISPTRYTEVAREAREAGVLSGERPLPVTLDQAAEYFQ